MIKKQNKKEDLEEKLIEELEENYDEEKGNKKLLVIGLIVTLVLIIAAVVLSIIASNKGGDGTAQKEETAKTQEQEQKNKITYDENYSRDPNSETAKKAGEPEKQYPPVTSGARIAVDESGKSIENVPIQKSLMIDNQENPFHALNTITPNIYDLMEINFYTIQNKGLTLSEFIERSRIAMPQELFNRLDSFYRIFMYRGEDEKGPGTAIVFSTGLDASKTTALMQEWEKTMVSNLKPLVLIGLKKDFVQASGKTTFQDSSIYKGGRYIDFSDNGVVSINYIITGKYIVIANSRTSFEKVISLLK